MYSIATVKNVRPFLWSSAEEESHVDPGLQGFPSYSIQYTQPNTLELLPVILDPNGVPWIDGCLFILSRATDYPEPAGSTIQAEAANLCHFMNTLLPIKVDHLDFSGRQFERPTYIYKASFKLAVEMGTTTPGTANNKIGTVIRYYRWKINTRGFAPQKSPWKSKMLSITKENDAGVIYSFKKETTDLMFKSTDNDSKNTIKDGGKLKPLNKSEQHALLKVLSTLGNPEMWLIFLVALITGMRLQTILTLRAGNIIESSENDFLDYPIKAGAGFLVDSKYDKRIITTMPGWLHHRLHIYLNSERYDLRREKAFNRPNHEQYLFLTKSGKPYYVSREDRKVMTSHEKGSAIRLFIRDHISPSLKKNGHNFTFSFHDLRATFGMNLVNERTKLLNEGVIGYLELIDYVKNRMSHSSHKTTLRYLNFNDSKAAIHEADCDFQQHIIDLIKKDFTNEPS